MLRIVEDEPGKALELRWEGAPYRLAARVAVLAAAVAAVESARWYVRLNWVDASRSFAPLQDNAVTAASALFVLGLALFALLVLPQRLLYHWRSARFEPGRLAGTAVTFVVWPRRMEVDLTTLTRAILYIHPNDCPRLRLANADGVFEVPLLMEGLDRRRAVELFFKVGRVIGWPFQAATRSDEIALQMELRKEREPGYDFVPEAGASPPPAPPMTAPTFDPVHHGWTGRVDHWEPGVLVRLFMKVGEHTYEMAAIGVALGAFFAIIGYGSGSHLITALGSAWTALLLGSLLLYPPEVGERRITLDWKDGTLRLQTPRGDRTLPLSSIKHLGVVVERLGGKGRPGFRCRLEAYVEGGYELLGQTEMVPSHSEAYTRVLSAALPLAQSLGVPIDTDLDALPRNT